MQATGQPARFTQDIIRTIIEEQRLVVAFQPICSVRTRSIVAVEALIRGMHPVTREIVPPNLLFEYARQQDITVEFDRMCRDAAFRQFAVLVRERPELTMFVNFDAAVLDRGVAGSGALFEAAGEHGIDPGQIVIEIIESSVHRLTALNTFVTKYRDLGFLLAVDDVGAGHSNLMRLAIIKPNVLKIDRFLTMGLERGYHKQEVFKSLASLGHKLGAMVVAEGVETQEQGFAALELGADLIQGYYTARPQLCAELDLEAARLRVDGLGDGFRAHMTGLLDEQREEAGDYFRFGALLGQRFAGAEADGLAGQLGVLVEEHPRVECMYCLDAQGRQITETVFSGAHPPAPARFIFRPAPPGADHSLKEYYVRLMNGAAEHLTDPYVSQATGRLCRTLSIRCAGSAAESLIVCTDFVQS